MSLPTLTQSQDQIGHSDTDSHSGGDFPPLQPSQLESTADDSNTDQNELCASCFKKEFFLLTKWGKQQKAAPKWISCDVCLKWYHGTCQGLQPSELNSITRLSDRSVRWFCDECSS